MYLEIQSHTGRSGNIQTDFWSANTQWNKTLLEQKAQKLPMHFSPHDNQHIPHQSHHSPWVQHKPVAEHDIPRPKAPMETMLVNLPGWTHKDRATHHQWEVIIHRSPSMTCPANKLLQHFQKRSLRAKNHNFIVHQKNTDFKDTCFMTFYNLPLLPLLTSLCSRGDNGPTSFRQL